MLRAKSRTDDVCEVHFVDEQRVKTVKRLMKPERTIYNLAGTFAALGDPTRLKIIFALFKEELCVCDIAHLLGVSVSAVSHQLRILRNLRLVKYHKAGRIAYYSLDDVHIGRIFNEGLKHVEEE
ncbi:MAG TPA: metalloregulator ArsR/SmtB family transcription factor [Candidatus Brocadiales bacterium]|nr:metalloregulator ArsR/SmtB family transcription factor [Candidatus Brocadiales bacterium]